MLTVNQERINVTWVSLNATVLSSSRYGEEYDRVKVLHEIGLEAPLPHDESFYIPAQGKALDTRTNFPDGNITNFAGQRFKDIQDELEIFKEALKTGNAEKLDEMYKLLRTTTILSSVVFKAGTKVLTFEYDLALYPKEDKTFELGLWAPMPTFNVVTSGQVVTNIQIPGNGPQFRCSLLEAEGYIPDAQGNPTGQTVSKTIDSEQGLRRIIGWVWQNDPLFKVRYQYQN
ncbi:hypothetical protein [Cytobacillus oceanisediminis]|uniref:Uncharacterized protein n=1 Tax=Cytobacillus oceanisediminis 2691 TaxID=1196031 RepID=A0A160ME94_9BACI|nr:hypothetical protein [Cytobacillus oceanisediminis]AND41437.1 hypothetical protein A361_20480 [Cytobacillus oceanisediminis 2691]